MDILNPQLLNIHGRIYCKYNNAGDQSMGNLEDNYGVDEHVVTNVCWDDPCDSRDNDIAQTADGRYQASIPVPSGFFKYIIGVKGTTKKQLEKETGATITIPPRGSEGDVIVNANNSSKVESAKSRIELLVAEKRWREPFTHFVTIPLTNQGIKDNFKNFKENVLKATFLQSGINDVIFQNSDKLHLTICTLVLLSSNEIENARHAVNECVTDLSKSMKFPFEIQVKGLEYMNDDPSAVDVLYAKVNCVDGSAALQTLADSLAQKLVQSGLSQKQYDRVKLHATLINTLLGKGRGENRDKHNQGVRATFDAREVLKQFKDCDFGSFTVNEIQLSERFTTGEDGYFRPSSTIWLST